MEIPGQLSAEINTKPRARPTIAAPRLSIAAAADIPLIPRTGSLQQDSSFPANAVPQLPSCAAPAVVKQLRDAVSDELRRSNVLHTGAKSAVDIVEARVRSAGIGSPLAICTAVLSWRRLAHQPMSFDLDYVVRSTLGMPAQVLPLGLNHIVERLQTDEGIAQVPLAKTAAGAVFTPTPVSGTGAGVSSRQVSPVSTRAVTVTEAVPALPVNAPQEHGMVPVSATPVAEPLELLVKLPKVVHGCEQPVTRSIAITCNSPSLLALNAEVKASLAALDHAGNTVELARIKRHADQHLDRSTTASFVADAYHYWMNAMDKIRRYEANYGSSGNPDGAVTAVSH